MNRGTRRTRETASPFNNEVVHLDSIVATMLHVICCNATNAFGAGSRGRNALCRQSTAVTIIMTAGVNAVAADAEAATCNMHGADDCLCVRVWGKLLACLSPHIVAHCAAVPTFSPRRSLPLLMHTVGQRSNLINTLKGVP